MKMFFTLILLTCSLSALSAEHPCNEFDHKLEQLRKEAQSEFNSAHELSEDLKFKLSKAAFHVEMCYGYIKLSVKYPAALETAKKVKLQGCIQYSVENFNDGFKNEAQEDVLRAVCK